MAVGALATGLYTRCFGHEAEEWAVELLLASGAEVRPGSYREDCILKVDFWVRNCRRWLPVQFSVDRRRLCGEKGMDCLRRGVIPSYLPAEKLEEWASGRDSRLQKELVSQFWKQVEAVLAGFPKLRLLEPAWR